MSDVSRDLDHALGQIKFVFWDLRGGVAQVRFEVSSAGSAENVRIYRRSGDRSVDRAAIRAVSQLDDMVLAREFDEGQVIQANIIIAKSSGHFARMVKQLERDEEIRIAREARMHAPPVLALTIVPRSPS